MPQNQDHRFTRKEHRQAEHIEEGYEAKGVKPAEAERRAWATVNKQKNRNGANGHQAEANENQKKNQK